MASPVAQWKNYKLQNYKLQKTWHFKLSGTAELPLFSPTCTFHLEDQLAHHNVKSNTADLSDFTPSEKLLFFFTFTSQRDLVCVRAKSLQLCPTLCDPMDSGPPTSSVRGLPQARILEWIAISSRGSSWPKDWTHVCCISPALQAGL